MALDDLSGALEARILAEQKQEKHWSLRRREWVWLAVLLLLALLAVRSFERGVVTGISMMPTYHDGQNLLVWKTAPRQSLKIGDVIVLRAPDGGEIIKRIVFLQNPQGTEPLPVEAWTPQGKLPFKTLFGDYFREIKFGIRPAPAPQETVYVLGDNHDHSEDSRAFGPVSPDHIIGKVL